MTCTKKNRLMKRWGYQQCIENAHENLSNLRSFSTQGCEKYMIKNKIFDRKTGAKQMVARCKKILGITVWTEKT
jgi:hypothetical protein